MAIVLEGTLQVSWFLEAIEGRMVGSLKEMVINILNPREMLFAVFNIVTRGMLTWAGRRGP